jgi:hypothetical protein
MKRRESNMICLGKVLEILLINLIFLVFHDLKTFFHDLLEQDSLVHLHNLDDLVLI